MTERLTFSAKVEVRAAPAVVFALVSDLRRKAPLNPNITVIRVDLDGGEPVREGSIFSHRFQREGRIIEYRSRCIRFVPPRLFESRSETDPPFEVRVRIEPTALGCRLIQEETVEAAPEQLDALEPAPPHSSALREALRLFPLFPSLRPLDSEVRSLQRERVGRRLAGELQAWLDAIRAEAERDAAAAGPSGVASGA